MRKALGAAGSASHEIADENAAAHASTGEQLTSLLVFRAGSPQPKAVPLRSSRGWKRSTTDKIELSNGRYMVQYRGQLMPLVQINGVSVQTQGAQPLLVFSDDGRSMGLVVDEIVDIVEDRLDIEVASDSEGILGSAVIKGQATEIIDVGHFLPLAFEDWFRRKEMRPSVDRAVGAAGRRLGLLPQHAGAGAEGRRLRRAGRAQRAGGRSALRSGQSFDVCSPTSRCRA